MILAIDVGNTNTVFGIFRRKKLIAYWRVSTTTVRTEDECWLVLKLSLEQKSIRSEEISGVVISSVVPTVTTILEMMTMKYYRLAPVIVSAAIDIGLKIRYDTPEAVGADRLCNAVAAYKKYGGPCIVVDIGTATTYDVISRRGEYLGGAIAPGIETASTELHRRTALLPKIQLRFPQNVIGMNTVTSMQSGVFYGALDALEGMIARIQKVIGRKAPVIATGGFSRLIVKKSKIIDHLEPNLVLEGAALIYERVKGTSR